MQINLSNVNLVVSQQKTTQLMRSLIMNLLQRLPDVTLIKAISTWTLLVRCIRLEDAVFEQEVDRVVGRFILFSGARKTLLWLGCLDHLHLRH